MKRILTLLLFSLALIFILTGCEFVNSMLPSQDNEDKDLDTGVLSGNPDSSFESDYLDSPDVPAGKALAPFKVEITFMAEGVKPLTYTRNLSRAMRLEDFISIIGNDLHSSESGINAQNLFECGVFHATSKGNKLLTKEYIITNEMKITYVGAADLQTYSGVEIHFDVEWYAPPKGNDAYVSFASYRLVDIPSNTFGDILRFYNSDWYAYNFFREFEVSIDGKPVDESYAFTSTKTVKLVQRAPKHTINLSYTHPLEGYTEEVRFKLYEDISYSDLLKLYFNDNSDTYFGSMCDPQYIWDAFTPTFNGGAVYADSVIDRSGKLTLTPKPADYYITINYPIVSHEGDYQETVKVPMYGTMSLGRFLKIYMNVDSDRFFSDRAIEIGGKVYLAPEKHLTSAVKEVNIYKKLYFKLDIRGNFSPDTQEISLAVIKLMYDDRGYTLDDLCLDIFGVTYSELLKHYDFVGGNRLEHINGDSSIYEFKSSAYGFILEKKDSENVNISISKKYNEDIIEEYRSEAQKYSPLITALHMTQIGHYLYEFTYQMPYGYRMDMYGGNTYYLDINLAERLPMYLDGERIKANELLHLIKGDITVTENEREFQEYLESNAPPKDESKIHVSINVYHDGGQSKSYSDSFTNGTTANDAVKSLTGSSIAEWTARGYLVKGAFYNKNEIPHDIIFPSNVSLTNEPDINKETLIFGGSITITKYRTVTVIKELYDTDGNLLETETKTMSVGLCMCEAASYFKTLDFSGSESTGWPSYRVEIGNNIIHVNYDTNQPNNIHWEHRELENLIGQDSSETVTMKIYKMH